MTHDVTEALAGPAGFERPTLCGRGATSVVFRAFRQGQPVALKRLNRELVRSAEALARFKRELASLQVLQTPGVTAVHDVIDWEGRPTLVMEYIEGVDLSQRVAQLGRLPVHEVEALAHRLLEVLERVHAAGIVHRDLKPQNIRLGTDGNAYVLDFGSARLDAASALTTTGSSVGTPEYMPPELFEGPAYDPRVDLYGLGATLYHALTGAPPQVADSLAELAYLRSKHEVVPVAERAPGVPAALAGLIDRCLARDPSQRFASARLARWALEHPEVAGAFALRRSRQPICLHCEEPIPASARTCPHCRQADPFSYAPGDAHVAIVAVKDPTELLRYLVHAFPERFGGVGLRPAVERVAAASCGAASRYASFVDRDQAQTIKRRLQARGVRVRLHADAPGRSVLWLLTAMLWIYGLAFMSSTGAPWLLLLASPLCLLPMVMLQRRKLHSAGGLLDTPRRNPTLFDPVALPFASVASAVAVASLPLPPVLRAFGAGATAVLGGAWWLVTRARLERSRCPPQQRPVREPGLAALLSPMVRVGHRSHFGPPIDAESPTDGRTQIAVSIVGFITALGVIVAEGTVLGAQLVARQRPTTSFLMPVFTFIATVLNSSYVHGSTWLLAAVGLASKRVRLAREQLRAVREASEALEEQAREQGLDAAIREAPARRCATDEPAHALVGLRASGEFSGAALSRALDLDPYLSAEAREALRSQLFDIAAAEAPSSARKGAMLSRCIMETDVDYELRFRFLELEGRLEAEAAEAWWRTRIGGEDA